MPPEGLFERAADDTRTEIMEATYEALTEYGYADLTIQRIADEFDKSKSLLYHHHDGKDDLLTGFLEFALDHFEEDMSLADSGPADERLDALFDVLVDTDSDVDEEFVGVLVELRAQAVSDEAYADQFAKNNEFLRSHVTDIIADGIDEGVFREVDPEQTASFLVTLLNGRMTERTTTENPDAARSVRRELDRYVETRLLAENPEAGHAASNADACRSTGGMGK
ncbi:TetR/AcrR family transcriptional regulator [Halorussus lipolyticus]|uniref:TetR/AcrR family transcriptional regulator n=1 Tax=Halorussus lipolyticus TaxID=3034024 RepID=UPI0023E82676|nr:TetR/AcrR family transcriptional regulator [Halorussus sp. DT80]